MKVPLATQIAAARRELDMRRSVYAAWVARGRLTQEKADAEVAAMTAIVATLEWLEANEAIIRGAVAAIRGDPGVRAILAHWPDAEITAASLNHVAGRAARAIPPSEEF